MKTYKLIKPFLKIPVWTTGKQDYFLKTGLTDNYIFCWEKNKYEWSCQLIEKTVVENMADYFEPIQEEHIITKRMREWKEFRQYWFKSWDTFWKEFFEELNKQLWK
jgi:hypothetical protein